MLPFPSQVLIISDPKPVSQSLLSGCVHTGTVVRGRAEAWSSTDPLLVCTHVALAQTVLVQSSFLYILYVITP